MTAVAFFFYLFSSILLASAFMVIAARNPVHAVLFLILAFFNAAGLFLLLGAEFLAMLLVVVYVGAVAVLFLFVVMMLDVDFVELKQGFLKYLPIGGMITFVFALELGLVLGTWKLSPEAMNVGKETAKASVDAMNLRALGRILYTENFYFFQLAGMVLLVAMIGAIVLTLRERVGVKRQSIPVQNARSRATAMDVINIKPGQGV